MDCCQWFIAGLINPALLVTVAKDGCGVSLPQSAHNRLIIDCDKPGSSFGPNDTKCDYLLFEAQTLRGAD